MRATGRISEIAALIGDPVRADMLLSLRDDGEMSAGELAAVGNVAPSTASEHLARMTALGLLRLRQSGRRRFYSLADARLCDVLDSIVAISGSHTSPETRRREMPAGHLHARLCGDHMAGRLGCGVAAALFDADYLGHSRQGIRVTPDGGRWLTGIGVDLRRVQAAPRCAVRLCPDWIEDAHHVGGAVGAALLGAFRSRDWVRTSRGDPAIRVTPVGRATLRRDLGLDLADA